MGCNQSKIENEETVNRCKERRQFMERAVTARNKFAAAHTAHAMSLKNTGAALSDFAQGEVVHSSLADASTSAAALSNGGATPPPPLPPDENFPLPPPPLPSSFNNSSPLERAATMPEFSVPRSEDKHSDPVIEEVDEEDVELESDFILKRRSSRKDSVVGGGGGGITSAIPPDESVEEEILPPPQGIQSQQHPPPPMPESKGMPSWDYFFSMENIPGPLLAEVDENGAERADMQRRVLEERTRKIEKMDVEEMPKRSEKVETAEVLERVSELPPQPPPPEVAMETTNGLKRTKQGVQAEGRKKSGASSVNLEQIFVELDDSFLKASESAQEVSRMLEATRLHYHSNFADKRGHINHSERVMRVITWNRSFRGLSNVDDDIDDFDSEENETHATVLDKMLAWEKKLYEEVKAGEQMKLEYQKKVASLNKLKKRGANTDALERMKASVSLLHTRYIVDMQSMDSTVSEINRLRDEQLYHKLTSLVDAMATMWETMRLHHENQLKTVQALRLIDISHSPKETSEHHHERTRQLCGVVQEWHINFSALMIQQKEYIKALNSWLKLNLVPIDTSLKEKVTSPSRPQNPPIQMLLHAWHDLIEKLPDEPAKSTIDNFAAVIQTIWQHQKEELDFKNKCADSRKDYVKKTRDFENWYNKYMQKHFLPDETDPDSALDQDAIAERRQIVEAARKKVEDDDEAYQRQCLHVREKSLMSLKGQLPLLFRALSDFALACSDVFHNLRSITRARNRNAA